MQDETHTWQLITGGKAFREVLLENIRQARREILIETHTLAFDDVGQALLSELEYACQRGLRVRCLLDGIGSADFVRDHPALLNRLETQFRIHHPPSTGAGLIAFLPSRGRSRRNLMLFDRERAVLGGRRLCRASVESTNLDALYVGPETDELVATWHQLWARGAAPGRRHAPLAWRGLTPFSRPTQVLTNTDARRRRWYHGHLRALLTAAQRRIWMARPSRHALTAQGWLQAKARQGLDIRVLAPPGDLSGKEADELRQIGCRLYEYPDASLQAHALLVDETAIIGSWHPTAFRHRDLHIQLCCRDSSMAWQLAQWLRERLRESREAGDD